MRLKLLKTIYCLMLLGVVLRLFYWQIISSDNLTAMAEKQHTKQSFIEAPRGSISSSDGSLLALNKPVYVLYGLPKVVEDKEKIALALAPIFESLQKEEVASESSVLAIDSSTTIEDKIKQLNENIVNKLSENLYWVSLQHNIDTETKKKIESLNLEGIGFENKLIRYYPESSSAAHILGFVGSDAKGEPTGYFGIEGYYNKELRGSEGLLKEEKDALGLPILSGKISEKEAQLGHNLVLNIDRTIQYIVEKKLKKGIEKYGAKSASAVVMDPKTGAILAMATVPNYDPNNFYEFDKSHYKNSIVADTYEPGSTFKVLVMAAGINEGLITSETQCDICDGPVQASGYTIRTWNSKYYPQSSMKDVIVHSDNTGMVYVARKLGTDKFMNYLNQFGFGNLTLIDLEDETTPDIRDKSEWRDIDLATASFGQGIAVTPIQMVTAVSSIANGGFMMQPQVVKSIHSEDKIIDIKPKVISQPIKSEVAKEVTQMMVEAVERGEAKAFVPKGYKIAGKTGTAQIPVAGHYDPEKTIASFVGFAPADDPKYVMLIRYVEPSSSIFGSETAAPTFFEITKELLTYFNIPPDDSR